MPKKRTKENFRKAAARVQKLEAQLEALTREAERPVTIRISTNEAIPEAGPMLEDAAGLENAARPESVREIMEVLLGEGIQDAEGLKDLLFDYHGLAEDYRALHHKFLFPKSPIRRDGRVFCPACSTQLFSCSWIYCAACGERLGGKH